ncbi:MAG: hypothetical protein M3Q06_05320 [Bacteroidota bacterium]|nr:hypothetical protein [Bacteroidota bacterium]
MKQLFLLAALCWLCSCNTLYVSETKTRANTPSIGVEWNFGDFSNTALQHSVDSAITVELQRFNAEQHGFTVYQRKRNDKNKDYITIDVEKGKVVGSGGKIAGYSVTALGLIAAPATLIAIESPMILAFYYWPNHHITSRVTLSSNLSTDRKNNKNLVVMTGALFASNKKQTNKLLRKYADGVRKTLLDIETQLGRN